MQSWSPNHYVFSVTLNPKQMATILEGLKSIERELGVTLKLREKLEKQFDKTRERLMRFERGRQEFRRKAALERRREAAKIERKLKKERV